VLDDMQSARTLILQTLNQGTQNATTYQAAAQQLQGINADLLSTSNTQYEGRPIFAGTSASSQAYDASGNYLGNTDIPNVVIGSGPGSGQTAALSVPGPSVLSMIRTATPIRVSHSARTSPVGPAPTIRTSLRLICGASRR